MDEEIYGEGWKHLSKSETLPKQKITYRHYNELPWDCGLCAHPYIDQDELPWDCGLCAHPYIDQDEVASAFDTRVNRPLRYCYILAPESVLHIHGYLLIINYLCTTLVKYICNTTTDIIYIHTHDF